MNKPLVSVVIPAFRSGPLIRESIESVLGQTLQDFEIVIVDNNASEDTRDAFLDIANLNPDKIRIIQEPSQGVCSARNKGIHAARGAFIALLDDDDTMYPHKLKKQVDAIQKNPQASLVYGHMDWVSFDGKTIVSPNKGVVPAFWAKILFSDQNKFKENPLVEPMPSVMFFAKERAIKVGLFDKRFDPHYVEDTEFCLRMWETGPFILIPEPLIAFRLPSSEFFQKKRKGISNWVRSFTNLDLFNSILVEKYWRDDDGNNRRKFKKIQSQWLRELSLEVLRYRDGRGMARFLLRRAFEANFIDPKNWKWFLRSFFPDSLLLRALGIEGFSSGSFTEVASPEKLGNFFRLPGDS